MINNEYKNSSEVYKVQTFRTTHQEDRIDRIISQQMKVCIIVARSKMQPYKNERVIN